jgi:hypothetical protein
MDILNFFSLIIMYVVRKQTNKAKTKTNCSPVCIAGKGSIKIMYTRISISMKSLRHSAFPHGWVLMTQASQVIV